MYILTLKDVLEQLNIITTNPSQKRLMLLELLCLQDALERCIAHQQENHNEEQAV